MRRLLRILLNAATVLSLLLCLATVVLWVRSFYVQDHIFWLSSKPVGSGFEVTTRDLWSVKGRAVLHVQTRPHDARSFNEARATYGKYAPKGYLWRASRPPFTYSFNYNPDVRGGPRLAKAGFRFAHSLNDNGGPFPGFTEGRLPHWLFVLATAILPILWLIRTLRARRRRERSHCPSCGYDCRATPDRCPECGTAR